MFITDSIFKINNQHNSISLTIMLQKYLKSMMNREEVPHNPTRILIQISHCNFSLVEMIVFQNLFEQMNRYQNIYIRKRIIIKKKILINRKNQNYQIFQPLDVINRIKR